MNSESDTVPRVVSIFFGLFFVSFGLPFALVPFMMISDGAIDPDYPFESLFMLAFSCQFDFTVFPFDSHKCNITFGDINHSSEKLRLNTTKIYYKT